MFRLKIYEELHKNKESKSTDFDAKIEEMKKLNDLVYINYWCFKDDFFIDYIYIHRFLYISI